jgi:hypothetical protein
MIEMAADPRTSIQRAHNTLEVGKEKYLDVLPFHDDSIQKT